MSELQPLIKGLVYGSLEGKMYAYILFNIENEHSLFFTSHYRSRNMNIR